MKRRRLIIVLVLACVGTSIYLMQRHARLGEYRLLIERAFSNELALIEQIAHDYPSEYDEARFEWIDQTKVICDRELSNPAIYWAYCTYDGHHGIMGFKSPGPGAWMSGPLWFSNSNDDGSRSLGYGTNKDGKSLLILNGYNPEAVKRHYMIAFLRETIDKMDAE